jgi:hypothetical protein
MTYNFLYPRKYDYIARSVGREGLWGKGAEEAYRDNVESWVEIHKHNVGKFFSRAYLVRKAK